MEYDTAGKDTDRRSVHGTVVGQWGGAVGMAMTSDAS